MLLNNPKLSRDARRDPRQRVTPPAWCSITRVAEQVEQRQIELWTIGHSNHEMSRFIELLKEHEIEVVADVRSKPYAGYAVHFSQDRLKDQLNIAGLTYDFFGQELGGRPEGPEFYDNDGKAFYDCLVTTHRFRDRLVQLLERTLRQKVALMCSEKDPTNCHRRRLITWALKLDSQHEPTAQWLTPKYEVIPDDHVHWLKATLSGLSLDNPTVLVRHIRGNGDVIEEQALREETEAQETHQPNLLEDERWKSAEPIPRDGKVIEEQEFHEAEDEENSPHQLGFLED